MKSNRLLKLLCLLSFLLLIAPFYDHCNGQRMKQVEVPPDELAVEEVLTMNGSDTIFANSVTEKAVKTPPHTLKFEEPFPAKAYHWIDDDDSENAFEIAKIEIDSWIEFDTKDLVKDFKKATFYEIVNWFAFHFKNCCFLIIVANTVMILIFSLLKKLTKIYKFTLINLWLLMLALIVIVLFESFFEDIYQIKWGYYVFIFLQIIIAVFARKTFDQKPE